MNDILRTLRTVCHILAPVFCLATLVALALQAIDVNALSTRLHVANASLWWTAATAMILTTLSIGWRIYLSGKHNPAIRKGDTVSILQGEYAGIEGYVADINTDNSATIVPKHADTHCCAIKTDINILHKV